MTRQTLLAMLAATPLGALLPKPAPAAGPMWFYGTIGDPKPNIEVWTFYLKPKEVGRPREFEFGSVR